MKDATTQTATDNKPEASVDAAAVTKAQEAQQKLVAGVRKNAEGYPHAMVGKNAEANGIPCTLRWDSTKNKFQCQIKCSVTGKIGRLVYTSDLFQVNMCEEEAEKAKKARKAAKKAEIKAALELLKTNPGLVKTAAPVTVSTPETAAPEANEDEGDENEA